MRVRGVFPIADGKPQEWRGRTDQPCLQVGMVLKWVRMVPIVEQRDISTPDPGPTRMLHSCVERCMLKVRCGYPWEKQILGAELVSPSLAE